MAAEAAGGFEIRLLVDIGSGDHAVRVVLPAPAGRPATGEDLYRLLALRFPTVPLLTVERTGQALARTSRLDCSPGGIGLVTGDRLVSTHRPVPRDPDRIEVEFLTGPARGTKALFEPDLELGRDSHHGLAHGSVSRRHCRLRVVPSGLSVEDLGATNGTVVDGTMLAPGEVVNIIPGQVVDMGQVTWRLVSLPEPEPDLDTGPWQYEGGRLLVNQAPRPLSTEPQLEYRLPDPPARPAPRRFPLADAVVPIVLGGVMAFVFNPYFALFMAMSPLMVVWTHLDDRRSGRRDFGHKVDEFRDELDSLALTIADSHDRLSAWQLRRTPGPDQVLYWVTAGSRELWWRRPRHDDFLTVAVGTADLPGRLVIHQPASGDADLRAEAEAIAIEHRYDLDTPLVIDLDATPVVGVTGGPDVTASVAASLLAQLVGLRSPRELQVAVIAPEHEDLWNWVGWLPHVEDEVGRLVAGDDEQAAIILDSLSELLECRIDASSERLGSTRPLPHVVVVLQPPVGLAPAAVDRFLAQLPGLGFSVLYLAESVHDLPGEVGVHIAAGLSEGACDVQFMATGLTHREVEAWAVDPDRAMVLARRLAPLVDRSAGPATGRLPRSVTLGELVDVSGSPDALAAGWTADPDGLRAVIGRDERGPLVLDLKSEGPHALVAGTTGAGKSEFLQTMLASLALANAPTDLNFILIDYKGGAAFRRCRDLPHTVGFVTDLDDRLTNRALVSLRAELRRREEVLARAQVSDLPEMIRRYRHTVDADLVPASLLIVIDEFAALRTEVPAFVDGLVDVAQRGRSMGVHMILATQKPGGVITPQIDANTNIRVALRVATTGDSGDVIGSPAAADIPNHLPGRGLLKIGGGDDLTMFQAAYVGGSSQDVSASIATIPFGMVDEPAGVVDADGPAHQPSDLDRIVDTVTAAWEKAGPSLTHRPLHRPWLPPLPDVVTMADLGTGPDDGVQVGLADLPHRQCQAPFPLDLSSNAAVYGTSGSGKTTLLHTVGCGLAPDPSSWVVYGIDGAGGLNPIRSLPVVADVVGVQDRERLQRLLTMIRSEVDRRRDDPNPDDPRWLIMIDGFASLWATLDQFDFGRRADELARLLSESNGVGVSFLVTADQRSAIPPSCMGAIGTRVVQRLSSTDEYRALELRHPPSPDRMPPGRSFMPDPSGTLVEVQVAVPGDIDALARRLRDEDVTPAGPPVLAMPVEVAVDSLPPSPDRQRLCVGVKPDLEPLELNLLDNPTLLIVGGGGSGKSTALATIVDRIEALADIRLVAAKRSSPLADHPRVDRGGPPSTLLTGWAAELEQRAVEGAGTDLSARPILIAVDDVDVMFDDGALAPALTSIVLSARDAGAMVIMTAPTFRTAQAYETWIRAMRSAGHGIVLQPDGDREEDIFDVRFPRSSALSFPPGRGYHIERSAVIPVQMARSRLAPESKP